MYQIYRVSGVIECYAPDPYDEAGNSEWQFLDVNETIGLDEILTVYGPGHSKEDVAEYAAENALARINGTKWKWFVNGPPLVTICDDPEEIRRCDNDEFPPYDRLEVVRWCGYVQNVTVVVGLILTLSRVILYAWSRNDG